MTPSQLYRQETQNGKLKSEIKQMLLNKALNRYESEELLQLIVLNEIDRPRKIYPAEIKRIKENPNMTPNEKLDIVSTLYTNNGYEVVERDRLGIQVFKKKKFSYLSAFLWFLLLGVGLVIYILYYLLRGDHKETIFVDDNYKVQPEGIVEEPVIILPVEDKYEDLDEEEAIEELSEDVSEHEEEQVDEVQEEELIEEESFENKEEEAIEEVSEKQEDVSEVKEKTEEEKLLEELSKEEI